MRGPKGGCGRRGRVIQLMRGRTSKTPRKIKENLPLLARLEWRRVSRDRGVVVVCREEVGVIAEEVVVEVEVETVEAVEGEVAEGEVVVEVVEGGEEEGKCPVWLQSFCPQIYSNLMEYKSPISQPVRKRKTETEGAITVIRIGGKVTFPSFLIQFPDSHHATISKH
jgi:hypothetical protein